MMRSYAKQIRQRINKAEDGAMFINADFADIANAETIRRNLNRLVEAGFINRVLKGIYEKPKFSKLLGEPIAPNPEMVAKTLARNYHWTIAPAGDAALNLLGLSTQVPATWVYYSDGPYKTYQWDKTKLIFKRRTNKEISNLSHISVMVIQALKALGKEQVTPEIVSALSARLSAGDIALLKKEAATSTDWVYDVVRKLRGGD
ncbi:MAG: DUF6088 family protein [Saccharofermentanales bacterium]